MVLGAKTFVINGGNTVPTCRVALAGVVFVMVPPPPVPVSPPAGMVLIRFPGVTDVTSMETVHEPGVTPTCGGTVPPDKDIVVPPGAAATLLPQVDTRFIGLAIKIPGCTPTRLSVQAAFSSWNRFGLKIVILRRDTCPGVMEIGENSLLISAG